MRAEAADPLVEEDLAARSVHHHADVRVLLLAELRLVRVRAPDKAANVDAAADGRRQYRSQLGARPRHPLARIPTPFQEPDMVTGPQTSHVLVEPGEISRTVNQGRDLVSLGPGSAITSLAIDRRRSVAALGWIQEPFVDRHEAQA